MSRERENFVSRRAMLPIAAGALASAAVIPAVAAQSSELASLIEAHRLALRTFEEWCGKEESTKDAYRKAERERGEIIVPCSLGSGFSLSLGEESIRSNIAREYTRQRINLGVLALIDSRTAGKLAKKLNAQEAADLAAVDRAMAEEAARQEAFGLTAVMREYQRWNEAEEAAVLALCAYVPRTPQEARAKAEYLGTVYANCGGYGWQECGYVEALLQSIAGDANV
jgi:hypothetical protein